MVINQKPLATVFGSSVSERAVVVLVHGLWMTGLDMTLLRLRLRRQGFLVRQFRYRTVHCNLRQNAERLQKFLATLPATTTHFIGHSLGGLVIRRLFHDYPQQQPGRIVTLGTPHHGSYVARFFAHNRPLKQLLGKSLSALTGSVPPWQGERELGSIAGSLPIGVGRVVRGLATPNDGTVAVEETVLEQMSDHLVLPVSHMGMLVSARVVTQAGYFLRHGHFIRGEIG
jgi:pimeloyl-ACP methyl ester carboxylesterase